jgi:hypothetical protein
MFQASCGATAFLWERKSLADDDESPAQAGADSKIGKPI